MEKERYYKKINIKYIFINLFIILLITLFNPFLKQDIFADNDEYNEIYTLEEIIKKLNELSKSKFSISFWTNIRFKYFSYNKDLLVLNNFTYYYIFNIKYSYYFSTFSSLLTDFNLATEDNIIYFNSLTNNLIINNIYVNKLIYNLNLSKLFNINFLSLELSFGQDTLNNSIVSPIYENFYYGLSNVFINKTFINIFIKYTLVELYIYYLSSNSILTFLNLDLLDFLKINVSLSSPPIKDSPNNFNFHYWIQLCLNFNNLYGYLFFQSFNNLADFSIKAGYFNKFYLFNTEIKFKISIFYDTLNKNNPLSSVSNSLSNFIKLDLKNYKRLGGEIFIYTNFIKLALIPYYAFELDDQLNSFFVDFLVEINIYPLFISYSSLLPIINSNIYNGNYLKVGIKTYF